MVNLITDLIPIPDVPQDTDEESIQRNERELGIVFPDDFRQFGRTYGTGRLTVGRPELPDLGCYEFEIYSPGFPFFATMQQRFFECHDTLRQSTGFVELDRELGLFPENGGLLRFGYNDNGVDWAFQTKGPPSKWTTCYIWSYDFDSYQLFDIGFSEFLIGFIEHRIQLSGFEGAWNPKSDVKFEPGLLLPYCTRY
jgi:hypothetical protein